MVLKNNIIINNFLTLKKNMYNSYKDGNNSIEHIG